MRLTFKEATSLEVSRTYIADIDNSNYNAGKVMKIIFIFWESKMNNFNLGKRIIPQILFAILIFHIIGGCGKEDNQKETQLPDELLRIANANPEDDLKEAIRQKDFRFLGVHGYSLDIPGIPDSMYVHLYSDSSKVRVIKGTTDAITSEQQGKLQPIAWKYARAYNTLLLNYLKNKTSDGKEK